MERTTPKDGYVKLSFPIVDLPEGEVLLATMQELEATVTSVDADIRGYEKDALETRKRIDGKFREAGAMMIRERHEGSSAESAFALIAREDALDEAIRSAQSKMHGVFTNPLLRRQIHQLEHDREGIDKQVGPMLISLARQGPSSAVPKADTVVAEAKQLETALAEQTQQAERNKAARDKIAAQIAKRLEVQSQTGFDSLYDAASLAKLGLQAVASPIIQKPGEETYLVCSATLARRRSQTHYEGRSSGWSFPIFHGIRYRVGSFRGYPISQEYVAEVDDGNLVLTNQRVAFAGE